MRQIQLTFPFSIFIPDMKLVAISLFSGLTFACLPSQANMPILVEIPVTFDPMAPMPDAVRRECAVDMLLGNHTLTSLPASGTPAQSVSAQTKRESGRVLQLTILSVHGNGGGGWSGAKSMSIRADLKNGDTVIRSRVFSRSSSGAFFGGFVGTCAILERVTVTLSKDVAKWVKTPSDNTPDTQPPAGESAPPVNASGTDKERSSI